MLVKASVATASASSGRLNGLNIAAPLVRKRQNAGIVAALNQGVQEESTQENAPCGRGENRAAWSHQKCLTVRRGNSRVGQLARILQFSQKLLTRGFGNTGPRTDRTVAP